MLRTSDGWLVVAGGTGCTLTVSFWTAIFCLNVTLLLTFFVCVSFCVLIEVTRDVILFKKKFNFSL